MFKRAMCRVGFLSAYGDEQKMIAKGVFLNNWRLNWRINCIHEVELNQKKTKTDLIIPKLRYRSRCPRPRESISRWIVIYCTVFIAIDMFLGTTRDNFIAFGCK